MRSEDIKRMRTDNRDYMIFGSASFREGHQESKKEQINKSQSQS